MYEMYVPFKLLFDHIFMLTNLYDVFIYVQFERVFFLVFVVKK